MKKNRIWGKYLIEFLSVFVAVISAFALNNWNENRRNDRAEEKILREIREGLIADLEDISFNKQGHKVGIRSCTFFRDLVNGDKVEQDSVSIKYLYLTVDNYSIMNNSGYEALKSKGLEIIENDSIRTQILSLYEGDYKKMYKYEETTPALQFFASFGITINEMLADNMQFDTTGNLVGITQPLVLSEKKKILFLSYLWRIQLSRIIVLGEYQKTEKKVKALLEQIERELEH